MSDVIEAYVGEVARHLPGRIRRDVAWELDALLRDGLRDNADAAGHAADEAMALELVRQMGDPAEVAARYHKPLAIVDPADSRSFVLAAVIGIAVLGVLTEIVNAYQRSSFEGPEPFAWIGMLTIFFASKAELRRRYPQHQPRWTPPRLAPDRVSAGGFAVTVALTAIFLAAYCAPGWFVSTVSGGRIEADMLSYTESFRHWSRIAWIPLLLIVHLGLQAVATFRRRWTAGIRWADVGVQVILVLQVGWHLRYGQIFVSDSVEAVVRPVLALVGLIWAIEAGVMIYREWGRIVPPAGVPSAASR